MSKAVIYVPAGDYLQAATECLDALDVAGYELEGIVRGNWPTAEAMLLDGRVDVVLVADRAHLPVDRTPRVEEVTEALAVASHQDEPLAHIPPPAPVGAARRRRPRPVN